MINDHIMLQSHLIHFLKTFYSVHNLKRKVYPPTALQTLHPNISLVRVWIGSEFGEITVTP